MRFNEITPGELNVNPFLSIGGNWMLVTASADGKTNTMTASWGGMGVMWNKNVTFTVIRPQRYTKVFVDASETFSLSFLGNNYKKQLSYLGAVSGRDEDKIFKAGLALANKENTPYFEESDFVLICKKLYAQNMLAECFVDKNCDTEWYPEKDYHTLYISEIITVLIKS